ncbi:MAG: DUF2953 domain-containing protein, partial [Eubacterium sp.]|nr:DUF2953 domain-containing protein [Eubacterium sp.]
MLAVLLKILSIIGIVLLWILGIILCIILLLLFTPFCYRAALKKHGQDFDLQGKMWWLFHFLHITFSFHHSDGRSAHAFEVYLLGIPILKTLNRRKEKKKSPKENAYHSASEARGQTWTQAKIRPSAEPGRWKYNPDAGTADSAKQIDISVIPGERPNALARLGARISALFARIRKGLTSFFTETEKVMQKLQAFWRKFTDTLEYLESESFYQFKELALRQIGALLKHILPRSIDGYLEFGTGDPAATGQILGLIAIFYPTLPGDLLVRPDFQEEVFEADISFRGHFFLIVLLVRVLRIVTQKEIKVLMHKIRPHGRKRN